MKIKSHTKLNLCSFISIEISAIIYFIYIMMDIFYPIKNSELFVLITISLILVISIIGMIYSIFSSKSIRQRELSNICVPKVDLFLTITALIINVGIVVLTLPALIIVIKFVYL
ncbi:hypothetical protein [Clostridium sp.]|uniref:hypothetical protein n=1 Tax=Clostridium sp. TaxID=1506 RepID=UPI003216FC9A